MSDPSEPVPDRRGESPFLAELIGTVGGLKATVEVTHRLMAEGQAAIRSEIAAAREVLVEKIEGGDRDAAAVARLITVQVANVQADVDLLVPRVERLERWQWKTAGGLAFAAVLIPFVVILVQHLWR